MDYITLISNHVPKLTTKQKTIIKNLPEEDAYDLLGEVVQYGENAIGSYSGRFDSLHFREMEMNIEASPENETPTAESEGVFKCRFCGGKNTQFTMVQTRSADEPMTVFVKCHNKTCVGKTTRY